MMIFVARMERSATSGTVSVVCRRIFASLHPGYGTDPYRRTLKKSFSSVAASVSPTAE